MLQSLPPELLSETFQRACTDSGFTGRSLSLVSRYIHTASAPFKYQSLALFGRKQILGFASTLEALETPPPTVFLYINGEESEKELNRMSQEAFADFHAAYRHLGPEPGQLYYDDAFEGLFDGLQQSAYRELAAFGRTLADAVVVILRSVAPALEVLHIALNEHATKQMAVASAGPLELPSLLDLTTCGGFPLAHSTLIGSQTMDTAHSLNPCPTIRSLNIITTSSQWFWTSKYFQNTGITTFAPDLTHLTISGLDGIAEQCLALDIGTSLGVDQALVHPTLNSANEIVPLPKSIKAVVLQPGPAPQVGRSGPDATQADVDDLLEHMDMVQAIRRLGQQDKRVVLLKALKKELVVGENHFWDEWLNKVQKGPGWSTLDEDFVDMTPVV
ncbi:hypothetical protein HMN09_00684300 [Mycena chlorophos]|uniref:Uncharacterized protein n=1 Tax=Mycena chlorophos TaxID=658473 RepID=A0A8H6WB74_MYCCL|nr:hypothetical protein HMN09_00684300 [Mycena chlorophos]